MKVSDTLASVAIIRQNTLELSRDIKTQFMKVSDILVIGVIIKLHKSAVSEHIDKQSTKI